MPSSQKMSTEKLRELAKIEVNEDPNRRSEDVEAIREWLKKQPHINAQLDEAVILIFLRNCEFSLERTKDKIDLYYTTKTALPQWFQNMDPMLPEVQKILASGMCIPLKNYDKLGRRVIIGKASAWDPSTMPIDDLLKTLRMGTRWILEDEQAQICGSVGIIDYRDMPMSILGIMTPALLKTMIEGWVDSVNLRIITVEIFHLPKFLEALYNLAKKMMRTEQGNRLRIQEGNIADAAPRLGLTLADIPKEYGGNGPTIQEITDDLIKEMIDMRDVFIKEDQFNVDEKKRVGKSKTVDDIVGTVGSFRKLNID